MSWRHRIAAVVLFALVGLPIGGTVCAMMCRKAPAQTAAHHGAEQTCADSPRSFGAAIDDESARDCGSHERAMQAVPATAAERADLSAGTAPLGVGTVVVSVVPRHHSQSSTDCASPPGTAPPTISRVVLRV